MGLKQGRGAQHYYEGVAHMSMYWCCIVKDRGGGLRGSHILHNNEIIFSFRTKHKNLTVTII